MDEWITEANESCGRIPEIISPVSDFAAIVAGYYTGRFHDYEGGEYFDGSALI